MECREPRQGQPIVIRACPPGESERYLLLATEYPMLAEYGATPTRLRSEIDRMPESASLLLVADGDVGPAGFVWLMRHGAFARSGYIRLLVIAREYQAKGVGDLLMDAAEEELLGDDDDVLLLVTATNLRARRFYERRGYHQVGALEDYVVTGQTECIYRKPGRPISG
ncbi:MAG: GNAT family N-acetyltransferase [Trueperaceae bacterium]